MADIAVLPTSKTQGEQFEQAHVRKIYNEIATSVNDIEHKAWPKVKRFLKKFETGSLIADIGCGNGRYLNINRNTYKIGLDVCCALVDNSRLKGCEVSYADNLHVPLRDNLFDGVVSIGVIHHFCSIERRIKAIKELCRILKPGGQVMVYVWAYEQKHRKFDSQDVLVPWHDGSSNNKRHGSSSSRHSSIGGMSSTSSVSEDDSLDIEEFDISSKNSQAMRRKSSMSLDDLTALTELSNFKPSYYSLDFTGSPAKADKIATNAGSRKGKDAIVKECRKLEESMRAMSADSLEEMRYRSALKKVKVKDVIGYLSLDGIGTVKHEQSNENFLLKDEQNDVSYLEEELLEEESLSFPEGFKYLHIDKPEPRCPQGRRKRSRDRTNYTHSAKINPFMKQNSLESYTFNNVAVSSDDSDSLEDIMEVDSENTTQDEVFVEFKPHGKDQTNGKNLVKEKSFFASLKTKLLSIFDDDDDEEEEKRKENNRSQSHCEKNQTKLIKTPTDSCPLTQEEMSLAEKLNFCVREFPQSSCPEILNKQLLDNGYCMVSSDPHSVLQCHRNSESTYLNYNHSSDTVESFHQMYGQIDHAYLNTDPGKMYKLGKEKVHECLVKMRSNDSNISVEDVIYDGFIKLDVGSEINGEDKSTEKTQSLKDALHSNKKPKEINISDNNETKQVIEEGHVQQNLSHRPNQPNNDTQNGCQRREKFANVRQNKQHFNEEKEDVLAENIKNIRNESPTIDLEKVDSEKSVDTATADVMHDSGISEREDGLKGKLCRYYHVFREGELEALIGSNIPELKVIQGFYDHANWCVVAEKC